MKNNRKGSKKKEPKKENLSELFRELDDGFIGIDKTTDDVFVYNATDVLVQSTWELPIVIQWPQSHVTFEFTSQPGEISFGIMFVAAPESDDHDVNDLEIETVEEMERVRSDIDVISGSFEVPCEGVVFFVWDNNFDWSSNKQISYLVEVKQPSFSLPDKSRSSRAPKLLKQVVDQLEDTYTKYADAQDCMENNAADVAFLEEQIAKLQAKLTAKMDEIDKLETDMLDCQAIIVQGHDHILGLGIRMLNKHLLGVILGFLDCSGGVNYVCKYWAEIASINRLGVISGSEIRFYEILNKEEQHRQLKQLYSKRDQVRAQSLTNNGLRPFDNSNSKSSLASVSTGDVAEATTGSIITSSTDSKTKRSEKSSPKKGPREKKPSFPVNNSGVGTVTVVSNSDDSDSDSDENVAATISTFERKRSKEYLFSNSRTNKKQKDISAKNGGAVMVSYDNVLKTPPGKKKADIFTTSKVAQNDPTSPSDVTSYQQLNKGFNPNFNKHVTIVEPEQSNWLSIDRKNSEQSIDLKPHPILRNALGSTNGDLKREIASAKLNNRESNNDGDGTESDDEGANPKPKSKLASVTYINRKLPAESQVVSTANLPANRPESRNTKKEASESEKILLQNIKKIRTEQQLLALLEYMQAGFIKIEYLNTEKRKLKKLIKAWNFSFERKNGRVPTANERKGHLRDLYEEYQQISLALRIRSEKMENIMKNVGLTKAEFDKLLMEKGIE